PRPDLPERLVPMDAPPVPTAGVEHSVRNADALFDSAPPCRRLAHEHSARIAPAAPPGLEPPRDSPGNVAPPAPRGKMTPLSPQKYGFQFTGDQETHDEYEKFRERMSHAVPSGEMALVMKAALKLANAAIDRKKFAATDRPSPSRGSD